jgi:hypothetical protein
MTDKNKKKSKSRKKLYYKLKKKPKQVEELPKEDNFRVRIKDLLRQSIGSPKGTSSERFQGFISSDDEFESEYNRIFKRTYRSNQSNKQTQQTIQSSPKLKERRMSVSNSMRKKNTERESLKSVSPDKNIKIYRSNLKYSSIWDLIQIFEKRKKIFSQPKQVRELSPKKLGKSIKRVSTINLEKTLPVYKNPTAEYYQSKKDVMIYNLEIIRGDTITT